MLAKPFGIYPVSLRCKVVEDIRRLAQGRFGSVIHLYQQTGAPLPRKSAAKSYSPLPVLGLRPLMTSIAARPRSLPAALSNAAGHSRKCIRTASLSCEVFRLFSFSVRQVESVL